MVNMGTYDRGRYGRYGGLLGRLPPSNELFKPSSKKVCVYLFSLPSTLPSTVNHITWKVHPFHLSILKISFYSFPPLPPFENTGYPGTVSHSFNSLPFSLGWGGQGDHISLGWRGHPKNGVFFPSFFSRRNKKQEK